jgi:hypothetical protein
MMWASNSVAAPQTDPISLFAEFGPRFIVHQQRPLGFRGQPIFLGHADWFHPSASVYWRVDIGATGYQVHRHQDYPDGP